MSKITLAPNASGTGTLTVAAPNTNTDRTITLPDVTTTLVGTDATQTLTNKSIAGSQLTGTVAGSLLTGSVASSLLTGALPAIDGSALTGIATGGMTLLGTLATTSGTSVTLSGLTLTSYKQLVIEIVGVSSTSATDLLFLFATSYYQISQSITSAANVWTGLAVVMLDTGICFSSVNVSASVGGTAPYQMVWKTALVNASTSVVFSTNSGNFDAGSIIVWGVK